MNTDRIIKAFKESANNKTATFADHIIYAIAKAYKHAKSEGEANYLSTKYVLRMASPLSQKRAASEQNGDRYGKLNRELVRIANSIERGHFNKLISTAAMSSVGAEITADDREQFLFAIERLQEATARHYVYIFVRQDIIPEQQAVQAAHATMVAGAQMAGWSHNGKIFDPKTTHFVLIGVPDMGGIIDVEALAERNGIETFVFHEEDMQDEPTALCTQVVTHELRSVFREYGLLKMKPTPKDAMRTLIDWVK